MKLSRRSLLGVLGVSTVAGAGASLATGSPQATLAASATPLDVVVPFTGTYQAGIVTPTQERLHLVALDVTTTDRAALVLLLQEWTTAARRLVTGSSLGSGIEGPQNSPPDDTGEADGLTTASLTLTFGIGASLFSTPEGHISGVPAGTDRFGIAGRRPVGLVDIPAFRGDQLDPARSGGDLVIQACADDPQVALHAVRNLVRMAAGTATVRWAQLGFGRTAATSRTQATPRNLFGFRDGTNNVKGEDTQVLADNVWVGPTDDPAHAWMTNGTYLVARKIRMHTEVWDSSRLADQESTIGRTKATGAPLGAADEFTPVDLQARGADGTFTIDPQAHIRLAAPASNNGAHMLRRGYSFADGADGLGHLDAGLFFLGYVKDIGTHFIPVQAQLAAHDALNEYITHVASAGFAIPPGVGPKPDYWASGLFV